MACGGFSYLAGIVCALAASASQAVAASQNVNGTVPLANRTLVSMMPPVPVIDGERRLYTAVQGDSTPGSVLILC